MYSEHLYKSAFFPLLSADLKAAALLRKDIHQAVIFKYFTVNKILIVNKVTMVIRLEIHTF